MAIGALTWDEVGEHFYETGVSKGVLYVQTKTPNESGGYTIGWSDGVAWNGLRSVSESPDGGDEQTFYADNIKYLSLRGVENFGGTIGAYQSPVEFDECDGTTALSYTTSGAQTYIPGVSIGQQTRKPFCFSYVTQKGNDQEGNDYGYVINIIYNATASPSSREHNTVNDNPEPTELSWDFKTTPVNVTGHNPTSILRIDSTKFTTTGAKAKLKEIEDALYGTATAAPKVLFPDDIIDIFTGQ